MHILQPDVSTSVPSFRSGIVKPKLNGHASERESRLPRENVMSDRFTTPVAHHARVAEQKERLLGSVHVSSTPAP